MRPTLITLLATLSIAASGLAAEKEDKHGPKGGELLDAKPHQAEFLVAQDRTATILFYDDAMKPVALTEQSAVIWAEPKSGRVKVEFERRDNALVSAEPLPAGEYRMMIQIKPAPDAKIQNFKFVPHHNGQDEDGHDHHGNGKKHEH